MFLIFIYVITRIKHIFNLLLIEMLSSRHFSFFPPEWIFSALPPCSVPWSTALYRRYQQACSPSASSCIELMGDTDRRWNGESNIKPFVPHLPFSYLPCIGCVRLSSGICRHASWILSTEIVSPSPSCYIGC